MKNFKKFLFVLLLLPIAFMFTACDLKSPAYVVSIEKTNSVNTTDTYTVTYSDGTKTYFTVENGKDGESLRLSDIEAYCEREGISLNEFLKNYIDITYTADQIKTATNIAMQSAVSIVVEHTITPTFSSTNPAVFVGSGVIYKMESTYSYIVTNYHVVHHSNSLDENQIAGKINIFQYGEDDTIYQESSQGSNRTYSYSDGAVLCSYVGGSDKYDIAVIKAPTAKLLENNPNACAVTVANNYSLAETVIAVGNAKGYGLSATEGIVSVYSEEIPITDDSGYYYTNYRVMRIDAAVNGGNSGGGVFNAYGELIGIVNAKSYSDDIDNMAYAIPYENAKNVADNIIYYHKISNTAVNPKQIYFGLYSYEENHRSVYNKDTNKISLYNDCVIAYDPEDGTLAHTLQFKKGDIIKSITIKRGAQTYTTTLNQSFQLEDFTLTVRAGDTLSVEVVRAGTTITLGSLESFVITNNRLVECDSTDYKKAST